jgi:hypothetical protein
MNFGGLLFSLLGIIAALLSLWFGLKIYFIISLQKLLSQISPQNRTIQKQALWYLLIPIFNLLWNFNVMNKIAYSLRLEYYSLGLNFPNNPTSTIGIMWAFSSSFYLIIPLVPLSTDLKMPISVFATFLYLLSVGLFFAYWSAIVEHQKILNSIRQSQKPSSSESN